jgi:hypothetical protein
VQYYNYSAELPFSKKTLKFREITTEEQLILAKANLSFPNDKTNYFDFNNFVIETLSNCIENKNDFKKLNIIDFVLFLTKIRIVSIGNVIELATNSNNKKVKTQINLNLFLKNLYNASIESLDNNIIIENNVEVKLGWPDLNSIKIFQELINQEKNQYKIFVDSFHEFIEYIKIKDKKILFLSFDQSQKLKIIEKLSVSLIKKVQEKILESLRILMTYDLWNVSTFKDHTFNFYNLNFIDFIRLFFSYDIRSVYQEICYMSAKGLDANYILKLSPLERKIHFSVIQEQNQVEGERNNNQINLNSSKALQDLALEFGDEAP